MSDPRVPPYEEDVEFRPMARVSRRRIPNRASRSRFHNWCETDAEIIRREEDAEDEEELLDTIEELGIRMGLSYEDMIALYEMLRVRPDVSDDRDEGSYDSDEGSVDDAPIDGDEEEEEDEDEDEEEEEEEEEDFEPPMCRPQ